MFKSRCTMLLIIFVIAALSACGGAEEKPSEGGPTGGGGSESSQSEGGSGAGVDVGEEPAPARGCGNGVVDSELERCDDGNDDDQDGCTKMCTYSCTGDSSCDDFDICSGAETCDTETHRCRAGTAVEDGVRCGAAMSFFFGSVCTLS